MNALSTAYGSTRKTKERMRMGRSKKFVEWTCRYEIRCSTCGALGVVEANQRKKAKERFEEQGWIIDRRWASCPMHRRDLTKKEESE